MIIPEKLKERYTWFKLHSVSEVSAGAAFEIISRDKNGLLSEITAKIHALEGNVTNFQSWIEYDGKSHITMQIDNQCDHDQIIRSLKTIPEVESVSTTTTNIKTWGKRIIIIGGGAQVASVASGAIAEADRHNIRGETISVDTIAVIGEQEIADSISAVGKLQRVGMLILAGSLMGGKITAAVNKLRTDYGIPVIALNMAGSVTKACDLVVTDSIEAGVMAVMLISHIGKFNLLKVHGKKY